MVASAEPTEFESEEVVAENEEFDEMEEDVPFSLDIGLFKEGDPSGYHTTNDPSDPRQRELWTLRKSAALDIRVVCLDIIHGLVAPDSSVFCSLVVLEFRFDPRKLRRRVSTADVELVFSAAPGKDTKGSVSDPVVHVIAPLGRLSMEETTRDVQTTIGAKAKAGGSPVAGAGAGVGVKWEHTVGGSTKDATTVTGAVGLKGRTWGKPNCAYWTLLENATTKTGVPASMRTAILLHRADEEMFKCVFTVKAKADWKSDLSALSGGTPPDDPVYFDPTMPSTNKLQKFDEMSLGSVDLDGVADITFATVLENATKKK